MTTPLELETALDAKGWEPEYREELEDGTELSYPVYEILADGNTFYVELTEVDADNEIVLSRVWVWDEAGHTIYDVWDIEDVETAEDIVSEVEEFIESATEQ